jgi:hypothetical protein
MDTLRSSLSLFFKDRLVRLRERWERVRCSALKADGGVAEMGWAGILFLGVPVVLGTGEL